MRHAIRLAVAIMYLPLNSLCFAGEEVIGYWADRNNMNIYSFDQKGDFEFYSKSATAADTNLSDNNENQPLYKVRKGVFSHGKDICRWINQKGNLMIYVDDMQCCMMAQEIAGKLVLTEVFSKGHEEMSICENRVLNRIKVLPHAREE